MKSPKFFLENSDQQEINVHNVIQQWYKVKTKHIAGVTLFVYGACLPWIARIRRINSFFIKTKFLIPPAALSLGFLISAVLMVDKPTGQEEEIGEFLFSLCFVLFMVMEHLKLDSRHSLEDPK